MSLPDSLVAAPNRVWIEKYCTCGCIIRGFFASKELASTQLMEWAKIHQKGGHQECNKQMWEPIYRAQRNDIIKNAILRMSPNDIRICELLK